MPSKGRRSAKKAKQTRRNDPSSVVRPGELTVSQRRRLADPSSVVRASELTAAQRRGLTPAQRRSLDPSSVVRRGESNRKK